MKCEMRENELQKETLLEAHANNLINCKTRNENIGITFKRKVLKK